MSDLGETATAGELADQLLLVALSRLPSKAEREAISEVIETDSLPSAARAVLNTNEFLFLP